MADPQSVEVDGRVVELSNLDKMFYPDEGITKGDVVDYYRSVAEPMVTHLRGRPLTLRRFPDGIVKSRGGFFQKGAGKHFPEWIHTVSVDPRQTDATSEYTVCDDAPTLIYLANLACLEFHVWAARAGALDRPDRLILDIDPPDGVGLGPIRDTARRLRDAYTELGLEPFVQTTGGRGYHVVAPLDQTTEYDVVHELANEVAAWVAEQASDRLTTEHRKGKRGQRIYLDAARNGYAQTAVATYSTRARPGAPVAAPIEWSELSRITPSTYHVGNIGRRLASKGDLWADIDQHARSAATARERLDALRS